jgi:hypothetical protein
MLMKSAERLPFTSSLSVSFPCTSTARFDSWKDCAWGFRWIRPTVRGGSPVPALSLRPSSSSSGLSVHVSPAPATFVRTTSVTAHLAGTFAVVAVAGFSGISTAATVTDAAVSGPGPLSTAVPTFHRIGPITSPVTLAVARVPFASLV